MNRSAKKCYDLFAKMFTKEEFERLFKSLSIDTQTRFANASLLYQRAMKCRNCDGNVCLTLLCSSVEAISAGAKTVTFKDWLIKNKLETLANKSDFQLKKELTQAYNEYMKTDCRRGITHAFKKFLLTNCPTELRKPPFIFYKDFTPPKNYRKIRDNPDKLRELLQEPKSPIDRFERALDFIYSRFRCLFLHEAEGLAGTYPARRSIKRKTEDSLSPRFDFRYKRSLHYPVRIDPRTVDWFSNVVISSLAQYLRNHDK